MSDIDGMDAFNAVMDRLLDAERKMARIEEERDRARLDLHDQKARSTATAQKLALTEAERDRLLSSGSSLWNAAYAVVIKSGDDAIEKLRGEIDKTRDKYDGIPF